MSHKSEFDSNVISVSNKGYLLVNIRYQRYLSRYSGTRKKLKDDLRKLGKYKRRFILMVHETNEMRYSEIMMGKIK
jgi:hypothetical protein